MGTTKGDSVKQALLDLLAKEPVMVLSTAYVYAKNYVNNGIDITKAWTTAVQQTSILEQVRQKAWVEAYDSFKKDYENRLKSDLVAILEEIELELDEAGPSSCDICIGNEYQNLIQQKINSLRAESGDKCVKCINNGLIDDKCCYCTNHNLFKAESESQEKEIK